MARKLSFILVPIVMAFFLFVPALFAAAPDTIKIGAVVALTGRYASGGAQVKAGYEIAVEDINSRGGILVKEFNKKIPVELILLDDESDPTKTASRLETLSAAHKVVAYFGGFGSDLHAAGASVAEKNRVPYLGVAFALYKIHQQGFKYLFSPFWKSPDVVREVYGFVNAAVPADQRPRKVAIFAEKTDWGIELGGLWRDQAKGFGYEVVSYGEYAVGSKDFSDIILKAKAAGAELVLGLPTPPDGMAIYKQMKELGFSPKLTINIRAPLVVVWGKNLGKDGDYMTSVDPWHFGVKYPGVKELNEKHMKKYGRPADPITGPAYGAMQVFADAVARAGTLDRDKIRDAIVATNLTTVVGPVKFREDGTAIVPAVAMQWLNGKLELVWPKEFATATFAYPAPSWEKR